MELPCSPRQGCSNDLSPCSVENHTEGKEAFRAISRDQDACPDGKGYWKVPAGAGLEEQAV